MSMKRYVKIETFLPPSAEEQVISALNEAGLLKEGPYDSVYASSPVTGHWRPLEGASPHIGAVGEVSSEPELKLEFRIDAERLEQAFSIIEREHPYETPVINAIEVIGRSGA